MLLLQCILSLIWELDGSSQQHFSYLDKWMTFLIIRKKKKGLLNSENKKRREMLVIFLTLSCLLLHRWFLYWGISFTSIIVKLKSAQSRGPGIWLLYWIDLFTDTVYLNYFFFHFFFILNLHNYSSVDFEQVTDTSFTFKDVFPGKYKGITDKS